LLDVYLQTKAKAGASSTTSTSSTPAAAAASSSSAPKSTGPSADDKKRADALKAEGNALMSGKDYDGAIASYTKAIAIVADPVYFSNRAAAHGAKMDHDAAADDAQRAIDLDPNFTKAYSRLGHALFSSGDIKGSVRAYEQGLEREPGNANMQQALNVAKAKVKEQEPAARSGGEAGAGAGAGAGAAGGGMPDLSALAGLMGGGGGGGGGGMPDLASLMQNPQMMQMYVPHIPYSARHLGDCNPLINLRPAHPITVPV
jgi:small glutamine-rich tetratricopeptide repeat-containing protein alpha